MSQERKPTNDEIILDVLREVLARQEQRLSGAQPQADSSTTAGAAQQPAAPSAATAASSPPIVAAKTADQAPTGPRPAQRLTRVDPETGMLWSDLEQMDQYETLASEPVTVDGSVRRLVSRLVLGLFLAVLLVNLPLLGGLALARALPDSKAFIVRDGLLFKGSGPQVYVLEANHKRWVSSLDAFTHYGYRWEQVHQVSDSFVARFPEGKPLHVLLKCQDSPHIYRLENDRKRWIKDIPTFTTEGHVWGDVRTVSCAYLRQIPDGAPIPPDAGTPPQP